MEHVLRGEGQSKVVLCDCGKLYFTYGSITLHFDRDEFLVFAESVGRLSTMVRQAMAGSSFTPGRIPNKTVCH
jgi:hypothetical protein